MKIGTFARENSTELYLKKKKKTKRRSNIDPETLYNRKKIMYSYNPFMDHSLVIA